MAIKGAKEFKKWKSWAKITRKESMAAQCYACNGMEESVVDCGGQKSCPMYEYSLYGSKKSWGAEKKSVSPENKARLEKYRAMAVRAKLDKKEL